MRRKFCRYFQTKHKHYACFFTTNGSRKLQPMTTLAAVNQDSANPYMGEKESLRTARTILGHYFAMAHGGSLNAQLCLDKVRDRFWKRFASLTLIILTLISSGMILPNMGKWQVVIPTLVTCIFAVWAVAYTHKSLTEYMRPTNSERVVAKKWKKFLKIAYRLGLVQNLADSIRSESDPDKQDMILSENQFNNPWFKEKIRVILRKMIEDQVQGFNDATHDDVPDVAQGMHGRLLNWAREASDLLGIYSTSPGFR